MYQLYNTTNYKEDEALPEVTTSTPRVTKVYRLSSVGHGRRTQGSNAAPDEESGPREAYASDQADAANWM